MLRQTFQNIKHGKGHNCSVWWSNTREGKTSETDRFQISDDKSLQSFGASYESINQLSKCFISVSTNSKADHPVRKA